MIKVSLIIPIYNVEKYLAGCLESLVNQSLKELEFICINDGSTDKSLEILNRYAAQDKRFIIISQENLGQGIARNKGLEVARGEYIGFVDSDDWVEPNTFEILYNKAKELDLDIVECNYYDEFEDGRAERKWQTRLTTNKVFNWHNNKQYLFTHPIATWNKLFKAELIKNHNLKFSSGKSGEDQYFTISSRLFAKRALWLNDLLYYYVSRESSCVHTTSNAAFDMVYYINDIKNLLLKENSYNDIKKKFAKYASQYLAQHYRKIPAERQDEFKNHAKTYLSDKEYKLFLTRLHSAHSHFMENIFSIKNEYNNGKKIKVITLFGQNFRRAL